MKKRPQTQPIKWLARFVLLSLLWTCIAGCLLLVAPAWLLLPIRIVSVRKFYRHWMATLQLILFGFTGFLLEVVCGIRMTVTGSEELLERLLDQPMLIANHRTRLDWLFIAFFALRLRRLSALKIALREDIKYIPFIGWGVQSFLFPFISRTDKSKDLATIRNTLEYLTAIQHPRGCSLLLFPEGTDLSKSNLAKSQAAQEAKGLPVWSNVLLPRTAGFCEALQTLRNLNAIDSLVDITIGYVDFQPFERPSELCLWSGRVPREVHIHAEYMRWSDLPVEDQPEWLLQRFKKKEELLGRFYAPLTLYSECGNSEPPSEVDDRMSDTSTQLSHLEPSLWFSDDPQTRETETCEETLTKDMRFVQYAMNSFVISCLIAFILNLVFVTLVWFFPRELGTYCIAVTILGVCVTYFIGGFHILELDWFPVRVDMTNNASFYRPSPREDSADQREYYSGTSESPWASLVRMFGLRSSAARRSAYLETVRHRSATMKSND